MLYNCNAKSRFSETGKGKAALLSKWDEIDFVIKHSQWSLRIPMMHHNNWLFTGFLKAEFLRYVTLLINAMELQK